MALLIGDNFSYNGKKPNFERDSFETLAILKAFPEANIDNGHIAYCKETNKHYIFNDSNLADPLTGKWRELESEFSNLADLSDLEAYLTKDEAQSTYQPIGDYALKSDLNNLATKDEIPSLDGYATEVWVNSQGFLKSIPEEYITESELNAKDYVTNVELSSKNYLTEIPSEYITETELEDKNYATKDEIPDISDLALKSEIPTKVSQLENDSNYLTSVPDNYVTDTELQEAISGVQFELPIASNTVLGGIKIGAGLTINSETGVLSTTGGGTADAVDWTNVTSKPQLNGHDLVSGNNTLTALGIQPAGDYALKSDIPSLSGYATQTWVSEQGFLTSIPDNYITENELTTAIEDNKYILPIATTDTLGGIKVGAGLNITEDGILSATGGGTADAVNWENVIGRPTNLSQFTNDSGFITSDDLPDLSNYATQSWVQEQGYLTSIPDNYITDEELNGKGYLTQVPDEYITETELTEAINTAKYTLPIASADILGGIKVGAGLSINAETGVLSATGGGTADSVDWNNVLSKPDWITNTKPTYNYTEIEGDIPTSKLPIATTTSVGAIKVGSGLTIDGEGLLSATGSGSEITDVLDDKTYARTQGSWVDLTDWLTWAEL